MELYQEQQWLLFFLLLFSNCIKTSYSKSKPVCPSYCKCYFSSGMRTASCVGRRLPNIETGVPNNVQILDISNNSISSLENEGFKKLELTFLYKLQLMNNHIGNIDLHAFSGLTELRILDLSNNHLYHLLPATFEDTPQLRSLYLSGNKIKVLAGPLLISSSLEILDLSNCHLDEIHSESFTMLPSLLSLNLSNNQLTSLSTKALEPLDILQRIDLNKNPWSCDGIALELEAWLNKSHIQHDTVCKTKNKDHNKFQRIISINPQNNTEVISDDELLRLWSNTEQNNHSLIKGIIHENCKNINSDKENMFKIFDSIPSFWSFMIGLEIGIISGGITMWVLFKMNCISVAVPQLQYTPRRRNVQPLQNRVSFLRLRSTGEDSTILWTELEEINCPDTPPPPYRDCFNSLPRNNT